MGIVYVPQFHPWDKSRDLSDLERYGNVQIMSRRWPHPDDDDPGLDIMRLADSWLSGFKPLEDYIALLGPYAHIAGIAFYLGQKGFHPVRVLMYDRLEKAYWPIAFDPTHIGESDHGRQFRSQGG